MVFVQFRSPLECRKSLLVFFNTYSKPCGIMENMVIVDRFLFFRKSRKENPQKLTQLSLFISLSVVHFLL